MRHTRRLRGLLSALIAIAVVGVLATAWSTRASGTPPADPAQALHRLKDVARIDLPIDDASVDVGFALVPAGLPDQPVSAGEYLGAVSMTSGNTIVLRVSAYALETDAAAYALWWNTSGAKEFIRGSVAAQCGRIVIDGEWVANRTPGETIALLQEAYPDCTPYIPEKATQAPTPAPAPTPTPTPAPTPTPIPTQTPAHDLTPTAQGELPNWGGSVANAFAITNLVVSITATKSSPSMDCTRIHPCVSFTAKNTTKQVLELIPAVDVVSKATGEQVSFMEPDGSIRCYSFGSERIQAHNDNLWVRSFWASPDRLGKCDCAKP